MNKQPILETERLILRPFLLNDAKKVQLFCSDKLLASTTAHIPHPYEDGIAESWIKTHKKSFREDKAVIYAITSIQTKQLIGAISLIIRRSDNKAEIGYWIGRPFWNQGFCTEVGNKLLKFGFTELKLNKVHGHHLFRNPSFGRVFQKLGMTKEGILRHHIKKWGKHEDIAVYSILQSEYNAV